MLDVDLGYVPPIFMVFDVTVVNKTYSKIEFDPAKTRITTDTGRTLRYYDPGRAGEGVDPPGGNRFSTYYQTERGRSGIDKDINLERMGLIYKTAFHRFRPVFRGDERSGTLTLTNCPKMPRRLSSASMILCSHLMPAAIQSARLTLSAGLPFAREL